MNKNKTKKAQNITNVLNKTIATLVIGVSLSGTALAQATVPVSQGVVVPIQIDVTGKATGQASGTTPQLAVPEYTTGELKNANCNEQVWGTLVTNYLKKRGFERQVQGQIQVADQALAAPLANMGGTGGSCWEKALNNLKVGTNAIDGLLSIFSGSFDWNDVENKVMSQVSALACNQLMSYTNAINYGITSNVGAINNGLNSTIGNIGVKNANGTLNINAGQFINNNNNGNNGNGTVTNSLNNAIGAFK